MKSHFDEVAKDWNTCIRILFKGKVPGSKEFIDMYESNRPEVDAIEDGIFEMHGWTRAEFDKEMATRIIAATQGPNGLPN